jgi:hypothetical protein
LASLQRRWDTGEAQLFTLWGRRRVGKTLSLLEFARDKRHLHFEAANGTRTDQLADFSDRLAEATGRAALSVPDRRRALDAVADWARAGPVLLVLDASPHGAARRGPRPLRRMVRVGPQRALRRAPRLVPGLRCLRSPPLGLLVGRSA